jgi:hypothetical protein
MNATINERFSTTAVRTHYAHPRKRMIWGRALTAFAALFLAFDASIKVFMLPPAVQGTTELGYPAGSIFIIGLVELVCLAAFLIPRIAPLGAILWTGYLGGAIATHVRAGSPLFSHTLFPIYVAALIWAGLWLRDRRVRALLTQN